MLALVIGCFAVGLLARRLLPRSVELVPWLDHGVLSVTLPALIIAKLPELSLGTDLAIPVGAAWGCVALAAGSVLVGTRRHGWSRQTVGALLLVTALGNTTFLGLPMVESLLGKPELARALAFDQLGSFFGVAVYGSFIAARYGHGASGWRPVVHRLLRFPPFFAVLVSFAVRLAPLPVGLDAALGHIGRLVAPLAMLALGLRFRVAASAHGRQAAIWCLSTKLVLLPLTVLVIAMLVGGTHDPAWRASVLESGMPPMVTAGVVAARADLDEELATTVVGVGLLLALLSIPLLRLTLP